VTTGFEKTKAESLRKNGKKEGVGWRVAKIKYSANYEVTAE
jgi:hypothetical protein